jgi:hypothetical protein
MQWQLLRTRPQTAPSPFVSNDIPVSVDEWLQWKATADEWASLARSCLAFFDRRIILSSTNKPPQPPEEEHVHGLYVISE